MVNGHGISHPFVSILQDEYDWNDSILSEAFKAESYDVSMKFYWKIRFNHLDSMTVWCEYMYGTHRTGLNMNYHEASIH